MRHIRFQGKWLYPLGINPSRSAPVRDPGRYSKMEHLQMSQVVRQYRTSWQASSRPPRPEMRRSPASIVLRSRSETQHILAYCTIHPEFFQPPQ